MLLALAVAATACAGQEITAEPGEIDENMFVTQVADFEGDVGQGLSLTTDADGNPHMAYLAFEDPQTAGATPEPPVAEAPELPAVKHAHLVGGAWTRSFVAEGAGVEPGDETAIAVDPNGVHHIVWTEGGSLLYSNNAEGAFSEPESIADGEVFGPSIAVTSSGVPLVAFYQSGGLAEPDVAIPVVRVALGNEGGWAPETAAEASPGEPATTAIGESGVEAVVAYGSEGRTFLARNAGEVWESEEADADGGLGVSMAIDGDGNPHLAYYNDSGQVRHAHSIDGAAWETTPVGEGADLESRSSIALDAEGVHHITWQTADGAAYATNAEGSFAEAEAPAQAAQGESPKVGTGPESIIGLAWYDPEDTEVQLAVRGAGEPLLAVPQPGPAAQPTTAPTAQPTGPPPCEPSGTELSVAASGIAFDTPCLAAPAGQAFTIQFDNQDTVPHNVAIYSAEGGEELFKGDIITGPDTVTYDVPALDPGQYYFQCDVHPNMNGTFVVA
jgi:plastocyanin